MKNILITGATGNIGREVIFYLQKISPAHQVIIASRQIERDQKILSDYPQLQYRAFDFEDQATHQAALEGVDLLFLLRPPHISDVGAVFQPLLETARAKGVRQVIFLSVQGADKSKVIPHNKIERLIRSMGFEWIFVRPGYFMQNLTTTLLPEIRASRSITLPAGDAPFNWVDTKNIGEATAQLICHFEENKNQAFDITGVELKNFATVADQMSQTLGQTITYKSINPIRFYFKKRREGLAPGFALVMLILHFLPRFQKTPELSPHYQRLTGKTPTLLKEFIRREKTALIG